MIINIRYIFVLSYIFLLFGFFISEDLNGNALEDYVGQFPIVVEFAEDYKNSFLNYDNLEKGNSRQSPIFFYALSLLYKLGLNENTIRIINLNICFFSIIVFYFCLKLKYPYIKNYLVALFAVSISFSPSFRSLAIWPNSINLGLIFFLISIFYYLNFLEHKKFLFVILNILFLVIASYISPNYSVFSIFFFYKYLKHIKQNIKIFYIIFLNFILSLPALFYLFYFDQFFFFQNVVNPNVNNDFNINNIVNKFSIIITIIFFHLLPFLNKMFFKVENKVKNIEVVFLVIFLLLVIFYFNYPYFISGGGFFFKVSNYLFDNNILFYLFCAISFYILTKISKNNFDNFILIICLILSNPQFSIYHKYFDPLLLVLFITIFDLKNYKILININLLKKVYLFYIIFIILNSYKLLLY